MGIVFQARSRFWFRLSLVIGLLVAIFSLISTNKHVVAIEPSVNWNWANPAPMISESAAVDDIAGLYCVGTYRSVDIVGLGTKWACIKQGDGVKVGTYLDGSVSRTLVSFAYDTKMYPVYGTGSCEQNVGCIYIPESDTFVTKQNLINGLVRSLVIYEKFIERLTKTTDVFGLTTGYTFNSLKPDYVFKSADNYAWPVEGLGVSENGNWMAVEFRNRGLGILNMTTREMKRVTTVSPTHGYGYEPSIELAITNNGQHVMMTGTNYGGVTLYDVDSQCGDIATDRNMESIIPVSSQCKKVAVDTDRFITRFFSAFNPRFDSDGGELNFFAKSYTVGSRAVTMRANGYDPQRLDYLALGDSFTSGEGETDDAYYQEGTNDEFEKCHLSKRSYPYLIATSLGIDPNNVRSVACSGAVTNDIFGEEKGYWGQNNRLSDTMLGLNLITKTIYQSSAKQSFIPGRVHQIEFVKQTRPKIITIGIGGNDVGFMEKLKACVGLDTCEWAETEEGREKTAIEVRSAFDTLVSTYTAVHDASPKSKIYVIGYPKIINPSGQCGLLDGTLLNQTERTFMNEGIVYINQVIEAAALKAGVKYIDIQESFGEKALCGNSKPSVMNAIALGDDDSLIAALGWLKVIGKESFHPRPSGHDNIASNILRYLPNMLNYNYCLAQYSQQNNSCPQTNTTAPTPSGYWLTNGSTQKYATQHVGNFVRDSTDTTDLRKKSIILPARTFAANSSVRVEIHSTPVVLGIGTTDSLGAMSLNVELPPDLSQGFHTLHLYGTSFSGELIDLYQVIKYVLPNESVPEEVTESINQQTNATSDLSANQPITVQQTNDTSEGAGSHPSIVEKPLLAQVNTGRTESTPKSVNFDLDEIATSIPDFLIPSAAWLFIGTGFALYARLRKNR